jgi:hypothetical protein
MNLRASLKNNVEKIEYDVLLAYYIQTLLIATDYLFNFSYFYNLHMQVQFFLRMFFDFLKNLYFNSSLIFYTKIKFSMQFRILHC